MKLYSRPGQAKLYVDLIHPGTGKRARYCTGETERRAAGKAAQAILLKLEAEVRDARDGAVPITLADALAVYLRSVRGRPSHANMTTSAMKTLGTHPTLTGRASLDGSRWLHTLTPSDLDHIVQARKDEGNRAQTIAHELKVLRSATRYAAGLGKRTPDLLTDNRTKNVWRVPTVEKKTRYLSMEEFWAVFAYMDPHKPVVPVSASGRTLKSYHLTKSRLQERIDAQDLLVMLAFCGGRWSEVARLTWSQVDLAEGTVTIWGNKTRRERLVPMPAVVKMMLLRRRSGSQDGPKAPVFPGSDGGFRSASSCRPILRAMDAVGLNDPETVERHGTAVVHSLRHTFASTLVQNGADLGSIQKALGHANITTTMRYAHLEAAKAMTKLGAILDGVHEKGPL